MTTSRGTETAPPPGPTRRWYAGRDAKLFLSAQITSMIGDSSLWLAMGIWVFALTGSSSRAAMSWMFFMLGGLTGPISSILADRLRLRRVLIVTNLACAANVCVLLAVTGAHNAWLVYPVMFGYGFSYALLNAGNSAMIRTVFDDRSLAGANGLLATAKHGMNLVAPMIGAGLYALVGAKPVIVADAVSFVIAAVALSLIRARRPDPMAGTDERPGAWRALTAGLRHIMQTPALRRIVLAAATAVFGLGLLEPTEFALNSDGLQRPPAFVGVLFTLQGAGAVIGGLFAARAVRTFGETRTAGTGLTAAAVGTALMAVPLLPVVLTGFALYGAALPWFVVAQQTKLQQTTPQHLQGRAAGAMSMLTRTPQVAGIAIGSAVVGATGYLPLLVCIALLSGTAGAWLFASRRRAP
ncbi:MFS transporter [Dactylosporangium siamense]|uniref:MFS transporter n=1 Tax=Dactylosporangium siamense TaxID=685454 RepID=A0A919PT75_9ACTN|nr:MFS transporter [Dactylosporangium siamense]GIG48023.1 MFS transporter [Dactylosporangium siamense]